MLSFPRVPWFRDPYILTRAKICTFFSINYLFYFHIFANMITAIFICLVLLTVVLITLLLWCIGTVTGIQKRMDALLYVVSYIDLIQRKRFIRYLDQLSRKMSCNEDEMEDNQKQFLFHLSQELTNEIKRMEDDYKDLI